MEYGRSTRSRDFRAVLPFTRKYTKTRFEGVFFRQSAKRDPRTGEYDKIYCFWYADHEGKGHWKTVGRHSKGVRPATVRKERVKFLAEFDATGINPIERDKVTIGEIVNAYLAWGRTKGSTLTSTTASIAPTPRPKPTLCLLPIQLYAFRHKPCRRHRHVERSQPLVHQGRHLESGKG